MLHTAAALCGHGLPFLSEEESVLAMIGKYFSQLTSPVRRGSVESSDGENSSPPDLDAGSEHAERLLQRDVTRRLERCLTEAKAAALQCQVLMLPRHMTAKAGRDVLRCSADEPCGLRGASIKIYVEHKDGLKAVGSVAPGRSVTPTFELSVIFKADEDDGWPPLVHIFDTQKVLKLKPEYRLVKRKLYSSASPVVHHSC
ncbi:DNA damage-inducible transcript 4-like protein-like [Brachionichthys hirsutus]|uniref:DNA damage-inducible transcript 4-like protein-like n=1 Tax=Brachionichthys hirsutus TaxID=412623 RepID=UPI00360504E5